MRFTEAELRVDASRLSGSLALSLGDRPQIAGALTLDRLDLDAYLPNGHPARLVEHGLQLFAGLDLALEARIERLTWLGLRFQDITLDGRSVAGQLTLSDLSLHDFAGTNAKLTGALDLAHRTFDLAGAVQTARPLQLLRGLGLTPPLMLARLTPVTVSGTAKGDLDAFDLALELDHDDARLALKGQVKLPPAGPPTYALAVDGSDPDYRQLLDQMGILVAPAAAEPAPFDLSAKVTGDLAGQTAVAGTARLGPMSLTGEVDWQRGTPRPKVVIRLSAGEPSADGLASLAALTGLRFDPIVTQGARGGDWSTRPLAFGWLGAVDAEVEASAKGGSRRPGDRAPGPARAGPVDGRSPVERALGRSGRGPGLARRRARLALHGARARSESGSTPKALADWLGLPPVVEGKADLYVEATTTGANLRDLVRGLIGDVKVGLHDGRLVGADLATLAAAPGSEAPPADDTATRAAPAVVVPDLSGSFALKRGIATAKSVELTLGDRPVRLEGSVDLLLWAADLTFRVDAKDGSPTAPVGLKLVGPLDRPQLRLLAPPPPLRPEQAP